jgi:hypothetical protein
VKGPSPQRSRHFDAIPCELPVVNAEISVSIDAIHPTLRYTGCLQMDQVLKSVEFLSPPPGL